MRTLTEPCSLSTADLSLQILITPGYIGEFEEVDDHRSGKIVIQLNGRLNKCGVISPRFNIKLGEIEKWVTQLLPSRQVGFMVLTTSRGIMSHEEARSKNTGGVSTLPSQNLDRADKTLESPWFLLLSDLHDSHLSYLHSNFQLLHTFCRTVGMHQSCSRLGCYRARDYTHENRAV